MGAQVSSWQNFRGNYYLLVRTAAYWKITKKKTPGYKANKKQTISLDYEECIMRNLYFTTIHCS